jgi:hypothetical protein
VRELNIGIQAQHSTAFKQFPSVFAGWGGERAKEAKERVAHRIAGIGQALWESNFVFFILTAKGFFFKKSTMRGQ